MIGILCALPQEYEAIKGMLENVEEKDIRNCKICTGDAEGKKTVVVQTGVGKVCAALAANLIYDIYKVELVISTGLAGIINPDLSVGDVVISSDICYHDCFRDESLDKKHVDGYLCMQKVFSTDGFIVSNIKNILNSSMYELPPRLKRNGREYPMIEVGKVISGDVPVHKTEISRNLYNTYKALCVDMETAGTAQSCYIMGIPCVAVKIMSDHADERSYISVLRYMDILCGHMAKLIREIIVRLTCEPK